MDITKVKADLEKIGITAFEAVDENIPFLSLSLDIEQEEPVDLFIRISGDYVSVSTIELLVVNKDYLEEVLRANDFVPLGKYFISEDLNEDADAEEFIVDYGFEIPNNLYSTEMLEQYLNAMVTALKSNL